MSVEITSSAQSMVESISPLKTTHLDMCRVHFEIANTKTWYAVMREARELFGKNWRCQSHVKRRLDRGRPVTVWWEVPDANFATWVAIKLAVTVVNPAHK